MPPSVKQGYKQSVAEFFFNRQIVVEQLVLQLQFKATMFWQFEVIFLTLEISFFKIVILDFKGNKKTEKIVFTQK